MKESILIVEDQFIEADFLQTMLIEAGYRVTGIARSFPIALEMVRENRPDFVLLDIFLKGKQTGIDLARELAKENIPFVYLSANSSEDVLAAAKTTQPYGFLVKPFRQTDLLVTLEIAQYRHRQSEEYKQVRATQLLHELTRLNELTGLNDESSDVQQKLVKAAMAIQRFIPFDYLGLGYTDIEHPGFDGTGLLRIGYDEYQAIGITELQVITRKSAQEIVASPYKKLIADTFHLPSELVIPLTSKEGRALTLLLYSRKPDAYQSEQLSQFGLIRQALSTGLSKLMTGPGTGAKPGAGTGSGVSAGAGSARKDSPRVLECIVGRSHLLLHVFDLISQVAETDTSVLILGESGTGKEKIAECIHQLSHRAARPFIKLNCAALPASLIESELFGHEKGAFTGASEKRIGKFELAQGGTIFLDEIGELPVELQVKLLRVLQEKEIDRVGGKHLIKLDVRIIAATNKNLEKEVAEGRFRLDMYYRLNVYPIHLPPLRDRKEDIPLLAAHFIAMYNRATGKKVTGLSEEVLREMQRYSWPGNIRELEHLIQRSVLLARDATIESIQLPSISVQQPAPADTGDRLKTMDENERDHIIAVLKRCNGKVWGPGAAADILNLPPSTLKSRMKKLGIKKQYIF